jgi:hypothetical protein
MIRLANAVEKSTYGITVPFVDEDGEAVTPTTAVWTLSDDRGNVINSRSDVAISPLASTVQIVLTGADLALSANDRGHRRFTVKATYNSSLGSGLALNSEVRFWIEPLVNVT